MSVQQQFIALFDPSSDPVQLLVGPFGPGSPADDASGIQLPKIRINRELRGQMHASPGDGDSTHYRDVPIAQRRLFFDIEQDSECMFHKAVIEKCHVLATAGADTSMSKD